MVVAAALVAACSPAAPNHDGWWDPGVHAVDGYWVTEEHPCAPEGPEGPENCVAALEAATAILHADEPGARITAGALADYPNARGEGPNEITINIAGLFHPTFMILDLADGSRRTIGLSCGPGTSAAGVYPVMVCEEQDMPLWRVTGG
jgi:hypothetical protein